MICHVLEMVSETVMLLCYLLDLLSSKLQLHWVFIRVG